MTYATLFVITFFLLRQSHMLTESDTTVILHTATLSKVWLTVSYVCTYRVQRAFGPG